MPITYVGGWVYVQGDYSAFTDIFNQIYQASVSGGWGIHFQDKYQIRLAPANGIQIGQAGQGSVTIAKSQNENVQIQGRLFWGIGNASFGTTMEVGTYDAINDYSNNGSYIRWSGVNLPSTVLDQYSTLKIYDSYLYDDFSAGLNAEVLLGVSEVIDTRIRGGKGFWFQAAGSNFSRLILDMAIFGFIVSANQTFGPIRSNQGFLGIGITGDGFIRNLTVANPLNTHFGAYDALGGGTFFDVIDSICDFTSFTYYSVHTRVYRRQFSINITCKTKAGSPVSGVRVRAWNVTQDPLVDTPLFDVTTGAGGSIAEQLVTVETNVYSGSGSTGIYASLNDITLYINKIGWREVRIVDAILAPLGLTVEMVEVSKEDLVE